MKNRVSVILMLLTGLMTGGSALAKADVDQAKAVEIVKREIPGRILKVEQKQQDFKLKVLKQNGRVVNVTVDKKSGQIKKTEDKD